MPRITFLLPVYNGETYLAGTLQSLLEQDFDDFEILVVDDGSTDSSARIVEQAASPRIRHLHKPNGGLVDALNFGLGHIDAEFTARIDADDLCFPTRLSQQLDFVEFTGADAVSAKSLHIDEQGRVLGVSGSYGIFNADPNWLPAIEPYLPHPFLFARTEVLAGLGYRQAHLAEDADLCWRLSETHRIAMQDQVLGRYRLHDESVSAKSLRGARVQAYYSQIAAINALRRRDNQPELPYRVDMAMAMAAGENWDDLMELYADELDEAAQTRLRTASILKLLDLARWRKFQPLTRDITAAAEAVRALRGLDQRNLDEARNLIARASPADPAAPARPAKGGLGQRLFGFLDPR